MIRRLKNKLFATLCVTALTFGAVAAPSASSIVHAQGTTPRTVYVDVEKDVLGQAPILQPVKVTINDPSTTTIIDATKQAIGDVNGNKVNVVSSQYGNYVTGFADTGHNSVSVSNIAYYSNLHDADSFIFDSHGNQSVVTDQNWLKEKEYDGVSGWMFTVNNSDNNAGAYYDGDTKISALPADNSVIRWEFSAAVGSDIGLNDAYLPTQLNSLQNYDWSNKTAFFQKCFNRSDKSTLIRNMADCTDKTSSTYTYDLSQLELLN